MLGSCHSLGFIYDMVIEIETIQASMMTSLHVQREAANKQPTIESVSSQDDPFRMQFGNIDIGEHASVHLGDNVGIHHHYYENVKASQRSNIEDEKYRLLLDSLAFEQMDARLRNVTTALPDTCTWVFRHEKFTSWSDESQWSEHKGFLWIKGKPGCGKSTIMKTALNWTRRTWPDYWEIVSYFFNARVSSSFEKSSLGFYQSVTHQLLSALPDFKHSFLRAFLSKCHGDLIEGWSISELQEFLIEVARSSARPPLCLFVDALDEGDEDDVRSMVDFLEEISSHAAASDQTFRVCLSSRHYPNITIASALYLTIEDELQHDRDIEIYIDKKLRAAASRAVTGLRKTLAQKSEKVFLWVALVVPMLNKAYDHGGGPRAMIALLKQIPKGLNALFSEILSKTSECFSECETLLRWVSLSMRPLRPEELYLAVLYSRYSDPAEDFRAEEAAATDIDRVQKCILDWSRGLVEVTKSEHKDRDSIVQFIHESVRDYMMFSEEAFQLMPSLSAGVQGASHDLMKTVCVEYLSSKQVTNLPDDHAERGEAQSLAMEVYPFASYSAIHSFHHADKAQQHQAHQRSFLLVQMNQQTRQLDTGPLAWYHFFTHDDALHSSSRFLLHFLAEQNLYRLVQVLVDEAVDVHARDVGTGKTALEIACQRGFRELAECLLGRDPNPNMHGTVKEDALRAVSLSGFPDIANLLLDKGANINHLGPDGNNALYTALGVYNFDIAELLLDRGADFSPKGKSRTNSTDPLRMASNRGSYRLVKSLLGKGADVNGQDDKGETALHAALSGGLLYGSWPAYFTGPDQERLEVIELLLDSGADINARRKECSDHGSYSNRLFVSGHRDDPGHALGIACQLPRPEFAGLLLDRGADVNSQIDFYGSALSVACHEGHVAVAEMLLDRGADINPSGLGGYYGSPLGAACYSGQVTIAKLLLDRGAEINARGGMHGTALHSASLMGHLELVKLLLDRQADIDAQRDDELTTLMVVTQGDGSMDSVDSIDLMDGILFTDSMNSVETACLLQAHESIMRLLISRGADMNARTLSGKTALTIAAELGRYHYLCILLDAGAAGLTETACDEVEVKHALELARESLLKNYDIPSHRTGLDRTIEILEQELLDWG